MALETDSSGHSLIDVLDRVLDKGIVIDAAVRIAVVGIEVLGMDARVVVASIETYLRHADSLAATDLAAAPARDPFPPGGSGGGQAPPAAPAALLAIAPTGSGAPAPLPPPHRTEPDPDAGGRGRHH